MESKFKRTILQEDDLPLECLPETMFLGDVPPYLKCPIGFDVLHDPVYDTCGHTFCEVCIKKWLQQKLTCPISRKPLQNMEIPAFALRELLDDKNVKCQKCSWRSKLKDLKRHIQEACESVRVQCRFKNCTVYMKRKNILEHEEGCQFAPGRCEHCKIVYNCDNISEHYQICPEMAVSCKLGCNKPIKRKDVEMHKKTACPEMLVDCDLQCGETMKRKEVRDHKQTSCPEGRVSCDLHCGETMKRKEVRDHKQTSCPEGRVSCDLQCGETMKRKELSDNHFFMYNVVRNKIIFLLRGKNYL